MKQICIAYLQMFGHITFMKNFFTFYLKKYEDAPFMDITKEFEYKFTTRHNFIGTDDTNVWVTKHYGISDSNLLELENIFSQPDKIDWGHALVQRIITTDHYEDYDDGTLSSLLDREVKEDLPDYEPSKQYSFPKTAIQLENKLWSSPNDGIYINDDQRPIAIDAHYGDVLKYIDLKTHHQEWCNSIANKLQVAKDAHPDKCADDICRVCSLKPCVCQFCLKCHNNLKYCKCGLCDKCNQSSMGCVCDMNSPLDFSSLRAPSSDNKPIVSTNLDKLISSPTNNLSEGKSEPIIDNNTHKPFSTYYCGVCNRSHTANFVCSMTHCKDCNGIHPFNKMCDVQRQNELDDRVKKWQENKTNKAKEYAKKISTKKTKKQQVKDDLPDISYNKGKVYIKKQSKNVTYQQDQEQQNYYVDNDESIYLDNYQPDIDDEDSKQEQLTGKKCMQCKNDFAFCTCDYCAVCTQLVQYCPNKGKCLTSDYPDIE